MRNTLLLPLLAAALCACTPDLHFQGTPRFSHVPNGRTPADTLSAVPDAADALPHVYLTAVRFPDGYDWEQDTCAVEGTVWLDLYRDGVLLRSFPAGESVHPDMHRFTGGHLYADASTDTQTILYRDGKELFRFDGREALRGFLVREGIVHTLGQDRDGSGVTYRIDGHPVFRSETGTVVGDLDRSGRDGGALFRDGENILFCYCLPSDGALEYRIMQDGALRESIPFASTGHILDFFLRNGKVFRVQWTYQQFLFMEGGSFRFLEGLSPGESPLFARLVPYRDDFLVLSRIRSMGGARSWIFSSDGSSLSFGTGENVADILVEGDKAGALLTSPDGTPLRFRRMDSAETVPLPGRGYLASGRCALLHEGQLLLALTGRDGAPCLFCRGTDVTEIPFNGYFTSVTVE